MIELDIINPSDGLCFTIQKVWPDDEYLYVYDEGEHFYIKCDHYTFWRDNYALTIEYQRAFNRLIIYSNDYEQVRNITKNKGGYTND